MKATSPESLCRNALRRDATSGRRQVAVAFSGGADSTLLLHLIASLAPSLGVRVFAVHVDHGASRASGDVAAHCAEVAASLSLPFRVLRADPARVKNAAGRATEGLLRAERYRLLERAVRDVGAQALYLGHHQGDQVESVVLAALRGAGLNGLSAMAPRRPLPGALAVRPLLRARREQVLAALRERGIGWIDDPANLDPRHLRNRVRHFLLPRLREELGPDLERRLVLLARVARALWRRAKRRAARGELASSDAAHAAILMAAGRPVRRRASLALQWNLRTQDSRPVEVAPGVRLVAREGRVERASGHRRVGLARVRISRHPGHAGRLLRALLRLPPEERRRRVERRGRAYLDADRVVGEPRARTRRPGDRVRLLGMEREKRVKTLLIARKIPRETRDRLLLFEDRRGIVAIEGCPPAHDAALGPRSRDVLRIRVEREANDSTSHE